MNNSKLIDMFKQGNMVIPLYLLQHYKELKLTIDEFIFLMYLYNLGDKCLFDPSKFSAELNMELTKVMGYISVLTDKHLIRVEVIKNEKKVSEEVILLEDFYSKLSLVAIDEINSTDKTDSNIFEIIEKEFGRTLSPIEFEIIKAWLDGNMNEDLIKEAIKEATYNGVSNLRYIDKILYEWGKKGIKTVKDVEANRKKRESIKEKDSDIDLDIVDWNWFDEDE